jgi:ABC-type Na+ efflux pump permease subunit
MRRLTALVTKDLLLHWRGLLLCCVGYTVGARILLYMLPPIQPTAGDAQPAILFPLVLYFGLICVGWLVDRERSHNTFALLRALPVSDAHIVGAKFVACLAMHLCELAALLVVFPTILAGLTVLQIGTVFLAVLTFGNLLLAFRVMFADKLRASAPAVVVVVAMLAMARQGDAGQAVVRLTQWWPEPWFHGASLAVGVVANGLLVAITYLRFHAQDTDQLIG